MAATAASARAPDHPLAGIAFMCLAAVFYSGFDALTKWLVADFSPFQILCFRGLFAFLPWFFWVAREPAPRRVTATDRRGLQILRGILGFCAVSCFAMAFRVLPLALAVAIAYSAPLFTTALARPVLGESVGLGRWGLVLFGFAGVLLITHPSSGTVPTGAAWALAGALCYAATSLATRSVGGGDRPTTTMFYSMTVYAVLGAATLPVVWRTPEPAQWLGLLAIGLIGGVAQFVLFKAYRLAPASTVSPFEYTILAWSVVWGLLIWHEVPDAASAGGMAVIAAAGLMLARSEHRAARRRRAPAPRMAPTRGDGG